MNGTNNLPTGVDIWKTYIYTSKIWNVNIVLSLLQGVDGKDGDQGPAGEKGDQVRLMSVSLHRQNIFLSGADFKSTC